MICNKCNNNKFYITVIPCCDDCDQNGYYEDDKFITDNKQIYDEDLVRNQVENDGECQIGSAHGEGCHLYTCTQCKALDHVPVIEGC